MRCSIISFFLSAFLLIYSGSLFFPRWEQERSEAQISWDAGGYYWYLPSIFIYHDLKQQAFKDSIMQQYSPTPDVFQYAYKHESGNYVIRYTIGTAILEAPFFFIAHAIAKPLGFPADGFSKPYQFMIYLGGVLFALLGLWYLRKLLLYYYNDRTVAIVLLLLVFGTNYLNYSGIDVGMTHSWLFTLYVFILLNTHYYYKTLRQKYLLRLGVLIGMAGLIRPPEVISALVPLLWGMERLSVSAIKEKVLFLKKQVRHILPAVLICGLILSIQFIYWKYTTGDWFVYTYQDQGFSWLHPHVKLYAFNYQSGWLTYTPMMLVAIIGILAFIRWGKNKVAIMTMILVNYYIVSAWDIWDYGGYGGRAMIQNYPLLLFPLASFVRFIQGKKVRMFVAAPVLLLFTYFNLWWTYQAHKGTLIGSTPATSKYYYATIFRYNLPREVQKLRDNEDMFTGTAKNPILLYTNHFDTVNENGYIEIIKDGPKSFSFTPQGSAKWIRASADVFFAEKEWNVWLMTQFIIRLKKGDVVVQENGIRLQRLKDRGSVQNITVDARVRHLDFDTIEILFRNENKGEIPCRIDNLKVIGFNN